MTTCRVTETFHFQQTDLIQAAGKDVNDVTIMCGPLGQVIVELVGKCYYLCNLEENQQTFKAFL